MNFVGRCECSAIVKAARGNSSRTVRIYRKKGYEVDGFISTRKFFWVWEKDRKIYITDSFHPFCPFCSRVFIAREEEDDSGKNT